MSTAPAQQTGNNRMAADAARPLIVLAPDMEGRDARLVNLMMAVDSLEWWPGWQNTWDDINLLEEAGLLRLVFIPHVGDWMAPTDMGLRLLVELRQYRADIEARQAWIRGAILAWLADDPDKRGLSPQVCFYGRQRPVGEIEAVAWRMLMGHDQITASRRSRDWLWPDYGFVWQDISLAPDGQNQP